MNGSASDCMKVKEKRMKPDQETLDYYNQNADDFVSGTLSANMNDARLRFCSYIPPHGIILDLGCGSGRDTRAFLDAGFRVTAVDGSDELCALASAYTGIPVKKMLFQDLDTRDKYDGIWACASILHLSKKELSEVLRKIEAALKKGGVLYASFKYGEFEGMRGGRYFTDFTEKTLKSFWKKTSSMQIFDLWITQDVRPGRKEERWINLLSRPIKK